MLRRLCARVNCPGTYVETITRELIMLGVTEILNEGPLEFMSIRLLGKGQNGFVFKCRLEYSSDYYACKIRRFDASRDDLLREGYMMRLANSVDVGPMLMNFSRNVIVMELVNGVELGDYVRTHDVGEVRSVARELLTQCHRLDVIGVAHNELSRLGEHVLVGPNGKVYIIDFESATFKRGVNVPQAINALLLRPGQEQGLIREKLGVHVDVGVIKGLLHEYKRNPTWDLMLRLMSLLNLS